MAIGRKNPSEHEDAIASGDGSATLRLREAENATAVSRRGVLWRAGLATAAGAAALTALDERRADAATGGNFILGQSNNASTPTTLTPTADLQPMMKFDGSAMGATDTTVEIEGPSNGGNALSVHQGAGPSGTVGLAVGVSADGGSSAIAASSGSATAISGSSTSGTGVKASSTSGTALSVSGKAHFSRSGAATVSQGTTTKTVNVSGMQSTSLVLATLQTSITGVYVAAAVPASGKFTVHLNKATPAAAKFAWFVLN
jgi:hypothetical protein